MIVDALATLGDALEPGEADRLADALAMGRPWPDVIKELAGSRRSAIQPLLEHGRDAVGGERLLLASVLRGLSAAGRRNRGTVDLVWSGPTPPGGVGRSTYALAADLIDSADHKVVAATYSMSMSSPYVQALKRALAREVRVTLLVDPEHHAAKVQQLLSALHGARLLQLRPPAKGGYALMHAKFVVVDDEVVFVTSANFSDAAAESNLEVGVVLHQLVIARDLVARIDALRQCGQILDVAAITGTP